MSSNSLASFLDEDKYNSDRLLALKYIQERVERASTVKSVLLPISAQDEFIFDVARAGVNDNLSEVSELSDPFAELGGNIVMSAENKQKRRLSKVEADVLVMNSFPMKHMEIQNEISAEMRLFSQAPQLDVGKIMEAKSDDSEDDESEVFQQVALSLEQVGLKVYKEEKRRKESRAIVPKQRLKKAKTQEELDMEANSMLSGVWRMLDANSDDGEGFPITQPGYNFYEAKKTLVNHIEKTWDQKEEIRKKCEDWLKNVK